MTKHIGIVAVSAEGAALCYRTICLEGSGFLGPHEHPEITLHGFTLGSYQRLVDEDRWDAVGEMMLESAAKLVQSGAQLLICPDNTVHQGLDLSASVHRRRGSISPRKLPTRLGGAASSGSAFSERAT